MISRPWIGVGAILAVVILTLLWLRLVPETLIETEVARASPEEETIAMLHPQSPKTGQQESRNRVGDKFLHIDVYDYATRKRIHGAQAFYTARSSKHRLQTRVKAEDDGSLSFKLPGFVHVRIAAKGYAPEFLEAEGKQDSHRQVYLKRNSRLRIHFRDIRGAPVAGLRIMILPPLKSGRWSSPGLKDDLRLLYGSLSGRETGGQSPHGRQLAHPFDRTPRMPFTWMKASNKAGNIIWDDIPPGSSYHWAYLSADAPIDSVVPDQAGRPYSSSIPWLSGPFDLIAGQERSFDVVCKLGAVVTGTLGMPDGTNLASVSIRICDIDSPKKNALEASIEGESKRGDPFAFYQLRAGKKWLTVKWTTKNKQPESSQRNAVYFTSRVFQLALEEKKDVGILMPDRSVNRHDLRVRLLPPDDKTVLSAEVPFSFSAISTSSVGLFDHERNVTGSMKLKFDEPFLITGLPEGRVVLTGQFDEVHSEHGGLPRSRTWMIMVPNDNEIALRTAEIDSGLLIDPAPELKEAGSQWVLHYLNRKTRESGWKVFDYKLPNEVRVNLWPGEYDLILLPSLRFQATWNEKRLGVYWRGKAIVSESYRTLTIGKMSRALRVSGIAPAGSSAFISFGIHPWSRGHVFYKSRPSPDGRFMLRAVPTNSMIMVGNTGQKIQVGVHDLTGVTVK